MNLNNKKNAKTISFWVFTKNDSEIYVARWMGTYCLIQDLHSALHSYTQSKSCQIE